MQPNPVVKRKNAQLTAAKKRKKVATLQYQYIDISDEK